MYLLNIRDSEAQYNRFGEAKAIARDNFLEASNQGCEGF